MRVGSWPKIVRFKLVIMFIMALFIVSLQYGTHIKSSSFKWTIISASKNSLKPYVLEYETSTRWSWTFGEGVCL